MANANHQTHRLHIFTDPADPDVVAVLANDSVPGAIPVLPTGMAYLDRAHPSQWQGRDLASTTSS